MTNHYALERAKAAAISRDYEQAEKILKNILKQEPENTEALSQLGSVYLRADKQEAALGAYQKLTELDPESADALNNLGIIYRRLGRYEESLAALNQVHAEGRDTATVLYNLGNTYKQMGRLDEAEECFIAVIDENPNDVLAYNHLGSIQALKGQHQKALQAYWRGLQVDPNHPILHYNMGQSYETLGKFDDALNSYAASHRSNPAWIDPMDAEAGVLLRDNKIDEAEDVLTRALTIAPTHPSILTSLGTLRTKKYELEEAIALFNRAIEADERYTKAVLGLENVYELQGNYEQAERSIARLESVSPEDNEIRLMHARLLIKIGELENAEKRLSAILETEPENLTALRLKGAYFSRTGEEQKAQDCFSKILEIDPSSVEFRIDIAEQMIEEKNYQGAEEQLLKYLEKKPSDADGWRTLAGVYEAQNNTDQALFCYRKILELQKTDTDIIEAVYRLHKANEQNEEAVTLLNDLINSRSAGTPTAKSDASPVAPSSHRNPDDGQSASDSLDFINKSLELYEQALQNYDSDNTLILEKNLRALKKKVQEEEREKRQEQLTSAPSSKKQPLADEDSLPPEELPSDTIPQQAELPKETEQPEEDAIDTDPFLAHGYGRPAPEQAETPTEEPSKETEEESLPDEEIDENNAPEEQALTDKEISQEAPEEQLPAETATLPEMVIENDKDEDSIVPLKTQENASSEEIPEAPPIEDTTIVDTAMEASSDKTAFTTKPFTDEPSAEAAPLSDKPSVEAAPISERTELLKLFVSLKMLGKNLTGSARQKYLHSDQRVEMEYIIDKLAGKRGLLQKAAAVREQLHLPPSDAPSEMPALTEQQKDLAMGKIEETLAYMRSLTRELPDESLAETLEAQIEHTIGRLERKEK
ncbi:MAG: tetratricopeptide repeat protein [Spirochaetaceae bacterium]|jgi:tetratricopeptide (TPR) repeat protein|nr:tetratricopeptide repeat protein [Spirochaetaceae bacterium]